MATLPDYLNEKTEESLRQSMLNRIPADVDKSEGSFIWDSLSPVALELYEASNWAREVLRRGFATTAFGPYLDLRCEEHGITRRSAIKATGQIGFSGVAGTVVPVGTKVAAPADSGNAASSVEFETIVAGTLNIEGKANVPIVAVEAGANGNVPVGTISLLMQSLQGVTSVSNAIETNGGADTETDASLLERYLVKVRRPGTSGNKADYIQWALDIRGVGGVQVEPIWNGPGTVRLFILDARKKAPDPALIGTVQSIIAPIAGMGEGKAPIGANVTVVAAEEVAVNISVGLTLASGVDPNAVKAAIGGVVEEYLRQLAFTESLVRYSRLTAMLLDIPGIVDFANLRVNGGTANLEMQIGQVAVLGTVSLSG